MRMLSRELAKENGNMKATIIGGANGVGKSGGEFRRVTSVARFSHTFLTTHDYIMDNRKSLAITGRF